MDWTWTTDKLGCVGKLYHPYEIAVDGGDKYHSILWEYDSAGRRELYSDPTYGHVAADTSGWVDHEEPGGETDWVFDQPERYLYGESGGVKAMGRVAGPEIRSADGEPGSGTAIHTATGWDAFVSKFNSDVFFQWVDVWGGEDAIHGNWRYGDAATDLTVDGSDNIYISGNFGSETDFDPGPGSYVPVNFTPSDPLCNDDVDYHSPDDERNPCTA